MHNSSAVDGPSEAQGHPYTLEVGSVARDTRRENLVGRVMAHDGARYQLRPLNGGVEWEAPAEDLVPAEQSDAMSAEVARANAHSRSRP